VLEGKQRILFCGPKPGLRFPKQALPAGMPRVSITKPTRYRILQDREQQSLDATPVSGRVTGRSKELLRDNHTIW
jgi:hypothetical protein